MPFGNDGDFSHDAIVGRINSNLSNGLGNLAQRVLKMINANCGATVPSPGPLTPADEALLAAARGLHARVREELEQQAFHKALDALWQVIGDGDRYVNEQTPWSLKKTDPARMASPASANAGSSSPSARRNHICRTIPSPVRRRAEASRSNSIKPRG